MGEDHLRLLASFEVALPLEHRSGLVEPALALQILSLSEGPSARSQRCCGGPRSTRSSAAPNRLRVHPLIVAGTSHHPNGDVPQLLPIDVQLSKNVRWRIVTSVRVPKLSASRGQAFHGAGS
jgi:hypothetical protein